MRPQSIYNNSLYVPRTTPYHPQGNGATKQMHCTLNWTMMGLDFFKPKIRGQGLFQHWNLRAMTFFVHDYHGTFNFFSLPKSRGAEFFVQKNHGAQSYFPMKIMGQTLFLEPQKPRGIYFFDLSSIFLSSISRTHTWVWVLTPSLTNPCMNPYSIYNNSLHESSLHL